MTEETILANAEIVLPGEVRRGSVVLLIGSTALTPAAITGTWLPIAVASSTAAPFVAIRWNRERDEDSGS